MNAIWNKWKLSGAAVLVVLFLSVFKISLLHKGYYNDTDELPILVLVENFEGFSSMSFIDLIEFSMRTDHPIFAAYLRHIQVSILRINPLFRTEILCEDQGAFYLGLFNFLIALLINYFFYKVLLSLKFQKFQALLGLLILTSLVNSNLYLRHMLPYDASLLFYMISLYIFIKNRTGNWQLLKIGVFIALGFFSYYGYFVFAIGLALYLFFSHSGSIWERVLKVLVLAAPSLILLFLIESGARFYGQSFIEHNLLFSTSIVQGSSEEAYLFIFKYLFVVEGIVGIAIAIAFIVALFFGIKGYLKNRSLSIAQQIVVLGLVMYLFYASYAYFSGNMVFYGRLLHMYFPFVVIAILTLLGNGKVFNTGIAVVVIFSFVFNIHKLNQLDYPRSIAYSMALFPDEGNALNYYEESNPGLTWDASNEELMHWPSHRTPIKGEYDLVNYCFFYHYPDSMLGEYRPYTQVITDETLVWNHFMSFPAYTFEYCTMSARRYFIEKQFKIMLAPRKNPYSDCMQ